ncbi:site-specific integrase [Dehalobacter sp. DCM]|uniref:site-specific integrase n=1 Tax=Dehalobacter sp. DCM TaxID=2907827 RepID=UPI0030819777|nr:site-specific integrase [Dehalobacter sp. DCM]
MVGEIYLLEMEDFIVKTDHLQNNELIIKVAGHLEEKRGIYQMALSWADCNGGRNRKSVSTGLPVKGNKKRAETMLQKTRQEYEEMLMQAQQEKEEQPENPDEDRKILFADFMEQWLDVIRPDIKLTTYGGYCMNVKTVIAPYFREKGIYLQDLTALDINDFYAEQLKRVKATSVHKYHANISKALKYAVERDFILYSVMDKVKRPKKERFVGKFLKQSEVVELFEAVKGHKLELGVILGAFYGLRRSEIVGLKWEAIDFEANTITIEHTVTMATINGKRIVVAADTTKSKSSYRTLPLVPTFRAKLLAIREEQQYYKKLCGKSYNKAEGIYIYVDQLGNRIKPDYLTREFPVFMVEHEFRRMRFHDLRHSCASLLLACGVPLKQIQEWLGHSDFAITANTYAHLEFNSKLASANAMTWIDKTSLSQLPPEPIAPQLQLPEPVLM